MNSVMYSSFSYEWATPPEFFRALDAEFHFSLDPCATKENAKCVKYFAAEDDGLAQSWENEIVFCNPPYGRELPKWVRKCAEEGQSTVVVMFIPARTDTKWFHDYIYGKAEIRFVRGRLKFGGGKHGAPFPSMVVIFRGGETECSS